MTSASAKLKHDHSRWEHFESNDYENLGMMSHSIESFEGEYDH